MKASDLVRTVTLMNRNIPARNSRTEMGYIKVETRGDILRMTSSNDLQQLSVEMPFTLAEGEAFAFCVQGAKLREMADVLPAEEVVAWTADAAGECFLEYGNGRFSLPCLGTEMFPSFGGDDSEEGFMLSLDREGFARTLKQASRFVSEASALRSTTYVRVRAQYGGYEVTASDGYTLFLYRQPSFDTEKESESFLLPRQTVAMIAEMPSGDEAVRMGKRGNSLRMETDGASLISRLVEEKYPDVGRIIPKTFLYSVRCYTQDLADAVRRMMICSDQSRTIVMERKDNWMFLKGRNTDFAMAAEEEVNCEFDTPNGFRIGFNGGNLLKELALVSTERVTLRIMDDRKPILVEEDYEDSPYILLLMPVLI